MNEKVFNPEKLERLNNPDRLLDTSPEYIWDKLDVKDPNVMLDIGAGTGFFSIPFLEYTNGGKVYACDISDVMIKWMNDNIVSKYPNIIPVKMDEYSIPLDNEIADVVFMLNLHHELEEPEKMLQESYRLLKNNGKIFIVDWKKKEMQQGPPKDIRVNSEDVVSQLINCGYKNTSSYSDLLKHFLIIAEK